MNEQREEKRIREREKEWCCHTVWPDVEIKRDPNFTIKSLKSNHSRFYLKGTFFKVTIKSHHLFWATLAEKICHQKLSKNPIWSHWQCHTKRARRRHQLLRILSRFLCPRNSALERDPAWASFVYGSVYVFVWVIGQHWESVRAYFVYESVWA